MFLFIFDKLAILNLSNIKSFSANERVIKAVVTDIVIKAYIKLIISEDFIFALRIYIS